MTNVSRSEFNDIKKQLDLVANDGRITRESLIRLETSFSNFEQGLTTKIKAINNEALLDVIQKAFQDGGVGRMAIEGKAQQKAFNIYGWGLLICLISTGLSLLGGWLLKTIT